MGDCLSRVVFLEIFRDSPHLGLLLSICFALILTKMYWTTFWAIFFTNPSGHPVGKVQRQIFVMFGRSFFQRKVDAGRQISGSQNVD
jgi:hypothetical protein